MLGDMGKRFLSPQLPRELAPRGPAPRRAVVAPTAGNGIELRADEDGHRAVVGDGLNARLLQNLGDTSPAVTGRSVPRQVIE